jgi:membrane protein YdbS with pleckstrin-like domain
MAFPRRLLIPGEDVVLDLRPHWAAVVVATLVFVGATLVAVWLATSIHITFFRWVIFAAWIVVVALGTLRRYVWWFTSDFVVTTNRVVHREGFIAKRSMEIPLGKINDVRFEQGMLDRMIRAGTLIIQSASEAGREEFEFIRDPEGVQKTIYQQTERWQRGERDSDTPPMPGATSPPHPAGPPSTGPLPPAAPNITTELERLADLRTRGVLTEEEFQAQKARILGK